MNNNFFEADKLASIGNLCNRYDVREMYAFGSVVSNDFTPESDVDLLIEFNSNLSSDVYSENFFALHLELEKLFGRSVDLLTQNSLKNPFFIQSVQNNKQLIYAS